ncbi:MAG: hypothetical protein R3293_24375, partial [Candidatus Promineifilaceae bacterium]|nr:hypothetical protein [Candidatus Promineifilaceae bacterium]
APREGEWVTYAAADDRYTISFPAGYEMLENETVSVDGVTHPAPNTLTLVADNDSTADFVLTIQHAQYAGETSLEAALQIGVGEDSCYFAVPENSEPITIGGQEALIFRDTPCGPFGSTLIYTVAGEMIFLITIESSASFGMIEEEIRPILDTFEVS